MVDEAFHPPKRMTSIQAFQPIRPKEIPDSWDQPLGANTPGQRFESAAPQQAQHIPVQLVQSQRGPVGFEQFFAELRHPEQGIRRFR
jgi:hypothetical protein